MCCFLFLSIWSKVFEIIFLVRPPLQILGQFFVSFLQNAFGKGLHERKVPISTPFKRGKALFLHPGNAGAVDVPNSARKQVPASLDLSLQPIGFTFPEPVAQSSRWLTLAAPLSASLLSLLLLGLLGLLPPASPPPASRVRLWLTPLALPVAPAVPTTAPNRLQRPTLYGRRKRASADPPAKRTDSPGEPAPPKTDYESLTTKQLQDLLRERNLPVATIKEDLVLRLRRADGEVAVTPAEVDALRLQLKEKIATLATLEATQRTEQATGALERVQQAEAVKALEEEVRRVTEALARAEQEAQQSALALATLQPADVEQLRAELQTARLVQASGIAVAVVAGASAVLLLWVPLTAILVVGTAVPVGLVCLAVGYAVGYATRPQTASPEDPLL
eukprot:EG_transcript_14471